MKTVNGSTVSSAAGGFKFTTAVCCCFGFSMILAKTLHLVVAGKYVDLSELLSVNIGEPKSHVLLDGRFIFFYFFFGHDIIFPASMGEHFVMFHSDDRAAVAIHQRIKP